LEEARVLGRGIADALAQEGVAVALVARTQETVDKSVAEINATGAKADRVTGDLADWPSIEHAIGAARSQLGPIDI